MTDYGVQSTGYIRKPIAVILAELEAAMITEFGPGVIQTPQSPFGQLNGLMADLLAEIDERNLEIYQSYDPDQAEGTRLDILGQLRLISRGTDSDSEFRKAMTNDGQARVDVQDLVRAVRGIDGVTFAQVFVNETGETTNYGLERGSVAVSVIGGDDQEISDVMRKYVVPGVNTYGNTYVTSNVDGYCRSMSIIRPVEIPVNLTVNIKITNDSFGCPPPSVSVINNALILAWGDLRVNGKDVSFYTVRSIIEKQFSNVEVVSIQGERDGIMYSFNETITIGFLEIGQLTVNNTTITVVS